MRAEGEGDADEKCLACEIGQMVMPLTKLMSPERGPVHEFSFSFLFVG